MDLNNLMDEGFEANNGIMLSAILNMTMMNNANIQIILSNQASIFSNLFPEKTKEEWFEEFVNNQKIAKAKVDIDVINMLSK